MSFKNAENDPLSALGAHLKTSFWVGMLFRTAHVIGPECLVKKQK